MNYIKGILNRLTAIFVANLCSFGQLLTYQFQSKYIGKTEVFLRSFEKRLGRPSGTCIVT